MSAVLPCVLTIAGSDSSGGAGIQADIKTISAHRCYAASVITALTAQNTLGVQSVLEVPPLFVAAQLESVFSDLNVAAVKMGMLHDEAIITVVKQAIDRYKPPFVVLDPVMVAKGGSCLIKQDAIEALKSELFSRATVVTPNVPEAEVLAGVAIKSEVEQALVAKMIGDKYGVHVYLKGGHFSGESSSDVLYLHDIRECHWYHATRVASNNTHGTGCTLSSAIASFLARSYPLQEAIGYAKTYITETIKRSQSLKIGQGFGPMDHVGLLTAL